MPLSLLLEKYDVSTEEGLQKALTEIENEESEVDEALCAAMSRACTLEGRLRATSQAYSRLGQVREDAQTAVHMVDRTAALARDVSAKVRQLDLARSRVAECQRRVHDLIDLQLCSAGVEAAIKAHDYETGAAHVSRFLSMDPGSVAAARARGAPDPRQAMTQAADTLREHLVNKFEEAARKEDEAGVERLFKLFPQIGRADEGVQLLAKYLAKQLESSLRRACAVPEVSQDTAVFADAATRGLEAAAAAVERARALCRACPGYLPRAVALIQPVVCAAMRRVCGALGAARRLEERRSPLELEPVLAELALLHSRLALYFNFLRRKTEADASSLDEEKKKMAIEATEKIIKDCDLMRTAQDLLGHYLELERYYLEESVSKALKMAAGAGGASSSSLVDDVFYIARKVIRRAVCAGSVDGVCAVLNEAAAQLERAAGALRRRLRSPPHLPLPLTAPPAHSDRDRDRPEPELDASRALFLAHMREAESGAEWSERLATESCSSAEPLCRSAAERAKLSSCAAGLGGAAAAFRAACDTAQLAVLAALAPRLHAWADVLVAPHVHAEEEEDDADMLPAALEQFVERARAHVSPRALDHVLVSAVHELCARADQRLLTHYYTREGGLCVERRARRLAGWAGCEAGGARERAARLAQAAALLALERPEHAPLALSPAPRLTADRAKDILARRTDFKMEDIKRLKL